MCVCVRHAWGDVARTIPLLLLTSAVSTSASSGAAPSGATLSPASFAPAAVSVRAVAHDQRTPRKRAAGAALVATAQKPPSGHGASARSAPSSASRTAVNASGVTSGMSDPTTAA